MTWSEAFHNGRNRTGGGAGGVFDLPLGIKTVCGKRRVK
ncbi:hypothetical protein BvCmsKSP026_01289 [Escherichia coli]|nr:hypothetical protein ECSTECEH250_1433 [Escherichia coli STEC_EH250]GDK03605.1 hypothetical protein BvCmsKSP026_01289 [Escherichia coli]